LTLRFFGSVPIDTPTRIDVTCREVCASQAPFSLALAGAGAFPNPRHGSVLWIGATDGSAALSELATDLNARLDALGLEREERVFKPHLTVARSREPLPLTAAVSALSSVAIPTPIEAVILVRSHLGGPAARYEDLEAYKLGR
jgi:2'-5' RNA ligase